MSDIVTTTSSVNAIVPVPRVSMSVRVATKADMPFVDQLQKMHTHMVGWMPGKQLEGKIEAGQVLLAEDQATTPIGYCISQDTYSGRDDIGIIYQLNVLPLKQRNLVGAFLIKSVFERAAYGVKLFCLWCAQDIQANFFWESIGFVPIAFRTGSRSKQRIHIFWQRRIREGDATTPYWFPSKTGNGAVREDRLVVPIPLGVHWRDPMPMLVPELVEPSQPKLLPTSRPPESFVPVAKKVAIVRSQSKALKGLPAGKAAVVTSGGLKYLDRGDYVPEQAPPKPKREPKPMAKHAPEDIAKARDLRDRFLEQVNADPSLLLPVGKYEVCRALEGPTESPVQVVEVKRLEAA